MKLLGYCLKQVFRRGDIEFSKAICFWVSCLALLEEESKEMQSCEFHFTSTLSKEFQSVTTLKKRRIHVAKK